MKAATQVVLTADLTRIELLSTSATQPSFRHNHGRNSQRLDKIFRPIFNILGAECQLVFDETGDLIDPKYVAEFLAERAADLDLSKTADRYAFWASQFDQAAPGLFDRFLGINQNRIVICFEAAPSLLTELDRHEIPFLNITIDPVRFTDDLIMRISSNVADAFEGAVDFLYDVRVADIQAALILSGTNLQSPIKKRVGNAALVAGQMGADLTMIAGGRLVSLDDYADGLCEKLRSFDWIYIAPHPHADFPCRPEINLLRRLGANAEIRFAAGYGFLAAPEVSHVFTVGSSLGVEARHFGKRVTFLNRDPSEPRSPVERSWRRVGDAFFSPAFWAIVLANLGADVAQDGRHADFRLGDNQIRRLFGVPWSYPFLSGGQLETPIAFNGKTIRRLFDAGAVEANSERLIDDLSRLMIDADMGGADRDWHLARRAENGSDASIQMFTAYSETLGHFDINRLWTNGELSPRA